MRATSNKKNRDSRLEFPLIGWHATCCLSMTCNANAGDGARRFTLSNAHRRTPLKEIIR
jgi:hypothetical protein